jgi:hypothetical protein
MELISKFKKFVSKQDFIKLLIYIIFRLLLIVAGIIAVYNYNWMSLFLVLITLLLTFIPSMIEKKYQFDIPSEIELLILFFIYAALYLGEFNSFYDKFWWWDLMLHTISGFSLGLFGFGFVHILNIEKSIKVKLGPAFICIFAFCFSVSLGTIWEIYEFSMDSFIGLNMQKSGLVDTMWDLIVDSIGALFISVLGWFYLKNKRIRFLERLENKFFELNPKFQKVKWVKYKKN